MRTDILIASKDIVVYVKRNSGAASCINPKGGVKFHSQ